jgi:hypothetical protein
MTIFESPYFDTVTMTLFVNNKKGPYEAIEHIPFHNLCEKEITIIIEKMKKDILDTWESYRTKEKVNDTKNEVSSIEFKSALGYNYFIVHGPNELVKIWLVRSWRVEREIIAFLNKKFPSSLWNEIFNNKKKAKLY